MKASPNICEPSGVISSFPQLSNDVDSCPEWSHIVELRLIIFSKCGKTWPPTLDIEGRKSIRFAFWKHICKGNLLWRDFLWKSRLARLALAALGGSACLGHAFPKYVHLENASREPIRLTTFKSRCRLQICSARFLLEIASGLLGPGWLGWLGLPWPCISQMPAPGNASGVKHSPVLRHQGGRKWSFHEIYKIGNFAHENDSASGIAR